MKEIEFGASASNVDAFYFKDNLYLLFNFNIKSCETYIYSFINFLRIKIECSKSFFYTIFQSGRCKGFCLSVRKSGDLKVFKVEYDSQASGNEGKWFFTKYDSQAKKKIYFVEYESQADLKIFFVKYSSSAGWRNNAKKYLMY